MKNDHCSIFVHSIAYVFGPLSSIVLAIECIFFFFVVCFTSDMLYVSGPGNNSFYTFFSHRVTALLSQVFSSCFIFD